MIDTFINKTDDEIIVRLVGHANYNPGNDVVCAAVSSLVCAFANAAKNSKHVFDIDCLSIESGDVYIKIRVTEAFVPALEMFILGLMSIREAHPQKIKINQNYFALPTADKQ